MFYDHFTNDLFLDRIYAILQGIFEYVFEDPVQFATDRCFYSLTTPLPIVRVWCSVPSSH